MSLQGYGQLPEIQAMVGVGVVLALECEDVPGACARLPRPLPLGARMSGEPKSAPVCRPESRHDVVYVGLPRSRCKPENSR